MKKQLKKLTFKKNTISGFKSENILGGADKEPQTFMAEGCGTSVHRPMCEAQADGNAQG